MDERRAASRTVLLTLSLSCVWGLAYFSICQPIAVGLTESIYPNSTLVRVGGGGGVVSRHRLGDVVAQLVERRRGLEIQWIP